MALRRFILSDVEDNNACVLLPEFLSDVDLLSLSRTASQAQSYRFYVRDICIKATTGLPDDVKIQYRKNVVRFLKNQKCLQSITVKAAGCIRPVLKWIKLTGATKLVLAPSKRIGKGRVAWCDKVIQCLNDAIITGAFRNLQVLGFSNFDLSDTVALLIPQHMGTQIVDLSFELCHFEDSVAVGVVVARLKRVQEWTFRHCTCSELGVYSIISTVAIALRLTRAHVNVTFVGLFSVVWDTHWLNELRMHGNPRRIVVVPN
jgi:hypothetical protein